MYITELSRQLAHERDINDSLRNQLAKERSVATVMQNEIARLRALLDASHVGSALRASGAITRAAGVVVDTELGELDLVV